MRSSPSRTKCSSRLHRDGHVQVAGAPALRAGAAVAAHDLRLAVGDAGRHVHVHGARSARTRPVPRQVSQGSLTIVPCPRQRLQVLVRMNWPKPPRLDTSRMRPLPWHCGQVSRPVPGRAPLPPQVSQVTSLVTSTSFVTPKTASEKRQRDGDVDVVAARRRGAAAGRPPASPPASRSTESKMPPPKKMLKRSLKPNCSKSGIWRPRRPSKP